MPRFSVDVKALIKLEVNAKDEHEARTAADLFVEEHCSPSQQSVIGYNESTIDLFGKIVPQDYTLTVDGSSDVEEQAGE